MSDTKSEGDILTYNKSFEVSPLKKLRGTFPKYADEIEERISRVKDLMTAFPEKILLHLQDEGFIFNKICFACIDSRT